jgi:hypothetical protein
LTHFRYKTDHCVCQSKCRKRSFYNANLSYNCFTRNEKRLFIKYKYPQQIFDRNKQSNQLLLSNTAINACARKYIGSLNIKHGMSMNGVGGWRNIGDCFYSEKEQEIILDDHLYIFITILYYKMGSTQLMR